MQLIQTSGGTVFKPGDTVLTTQLNVSNLCIMEVLSTSVEYAFTGYDKLIQDIHPLYGLQIGYYKVTLLSPPNYVTKTEYEADMGDIDTALDSIITIQNSLIGGNS